MSFVFERYGPRCRRTYFLVGSIKRIDDSAAEALYTPNKDFIGTDEFAYKANDGTADSNVATVTILVRSGNIAPVADAGAPQKVFLGDVTVLDGSASDDPDNSPKPLSFSWQFSSVPLLSNLTNTDILDSDAVSPQFTPDVVGKFELVLEVFDGLGNDSDSVTITVESVDQQVIKDLAARPQRSKISLFWEPIPEAKSYNIYRQKGSNVSHALIKQGHVTDYATYLDKGLTTGVTYCYRIRWIDANNRESFDSNEACITPTERRNR